MKATQFARRLEQLGRMYGDCKILEVFPLCLRNSASDWHGGLPVVIQDKMARSIKETKKQLVMRWAPDAFTALDNATAL